MAPEARELFPGHEVKNAEVFAIHLTEGTFDPAQFDAWASDLRYPADPADKFMLKYVHRGEVVAVFPRKQNHGVVDYNLPNNAPIYQGDLKSAGFITISITEDKVTRTIHDYSLTMDSILSIEESNAGRKELEEVLSPYFTFEYPEPPRRS